MPTIVQTVNGTVTGLWGSALVRTPTGKLHALKMGDIVHKGDVILTTQDGIVMLTPDTAAPKAAAADAAPEIDRVIAELNQPDSQTAPAAGLTGGDGSGLTPGLRVDRISEGITSASFVEGTETVPPAFTDVPSTVSSQQAQAVPALAASSSTISAAEEGVAVNLGLAQPSGAGTIAVTVQQVPSVGAIVKADGTVVTAGMALQASDLPGLRYEPPADYNGIDPVGSFRYTATDGSESASGSTAISLATFNDRPVADSASLAGAEDATLPLSLTGQDPDGTVSSVTVTGIPVGSLVFLSDGSTPVLAGQTLTAAQAGSLLFKPATDFNGGTAISFTVTDNDGGVSAPASIQITLSAVNDVPVGNADSGHTPENTVLGGNVLGNDTDVDGPALSVTQYSINGTAHAAGTATALPGIGTLLINGDGSYLFTPAASYHGPVPVATYTVSDGSLAATSTLTINVDSVNQAPVASDDAAATPINRPVSIDVLANDTDIDGDSLTVTGAALANPAQGTVAVAPNGQLVFTPAANVSGPVAITYTVADPSGASDTATVTVNVGANTAPAGADGVHTLAEDSSYAIQPGDFGYADADAGQTFASVRIDTLPSGSLLLNGNPVSAGALVPVAEIAAGHLVFTPAANANGAPLTSFTFSVQDSAGAFDATPNTLGFNVTPLDDAPAASPDVVSTNEDTPVTFDPRGNDSDVDSPALGIVSVGGQPIAVGTPVVLPQGTVSMNPDGTLSFAPAPNFNGPVNVPYTVSDGSAQASSTLTINVAPVNDAPVANDDTVSTPINTQVSIDVRANDGDGDGDLLTPSNPVLTNPAQGVASFDSNGHLAFTPAANVTGPVVITYTVTDPAGASDTATVTVNVGANTAPAGADGVRTIGEDTAYNLQPADFGFSDADAGQAFAGVRIDAPPAAGTLLLNSAPVAAGSFVTAAEITAGHLVFAPAANGNGVGYAGIAFSVQDSAGAFDSAPNTLTFNVTPVDDAPVANDDVASTAINSAVLIDVKANDSDPDNTRAELTVSNPVVDPGKGTVTIDPSGQLLFTPTANVSGMVTITYTLTDPSGLHDTATITVNVGGNTPPSGADASRTVVEDTAYTVAAADFGFSDADAGQAFAAVRIDTLPTNGQLLLNGGAVAAGAVISAAEVAAGHLQFVPAANQSGAPYGSFSFSVQDSAGAFDAAPNTFTLNVTPVNDAPVPHPDTVAATEDTPVTFDPRLNDTDVDGPALAVIQVAGQPIAVGAPVTLPQGTVSMNPDGTLTFTPTPDFSGPVSIPYTVSDGSTPATSTISINVAPVADAPVITGPLAGSVTEDVTLVRSGTLTISDPDGPAESSFVAQGGTAGTYGSFALTSTGTWTYTLNNAAANVQALAGGSSVDEAFTITTADGSTRSVVVTVNGTNDAPVAIADSGTATEDTPLTGNVLANDSDVDAGSALSVTQFAVNGNTYVAGQTAMLAQGTLTIAGNGSYAFTPAADYNGIVPVATYTVSDGNATSIATLTLAVSAVNDAPVALNDSATLAEDTARNGNVIANDHDADGDALSVTQFAINGNTYAAGLTAMLPQGTLVIAANGDYTFIPAANYNGPVPVATYTLSDGLVTTTATLTLSVTPVPDAPVANDDTASTNINTPITVDVLSNDNDADGDTLTVSNPVLANPAQGTVSVDATGHLVFTPANNFSGAVQIQYTVTDPGGLSDTATLTVNVGTNTPPTGADAARTINEDTPYVVQAGDFGFADADAGQTLINVRIDTLPAAGTLLLNGSAVGAGQVVSVAEVNAGHLVFSPAANANGANYAAFSFSVQDNAGAFDTAPNTLGFNVVPVADPAVIAPGFGAVTEDVAVNGAGRLTTGGTLAVADPDAGEAAFQPQAATAGAYGSFTLGANGAWTYAAANNSASIQALGAGQTLTETFTVRSVDGTPSTLVVTINGTNDAAVISAGTGSVTEDLAVNGAGNLTTGGTLTVTDVDTGQASFQPQASTAGAYGSFTLAANGAWTYAAANGNPAIQALGAGQTLTETFTVKSADGTSSSVVVTINGTNDVAVVSAGTGSVTEDVAVNGAGNLTTGGTLTVTDADAGQASFQAQASTGGAYGTFTLGTNGAWTYTASNGNPAIQALGAGQTLTETFVVKSADGTPSSVVVTLNGTNDVAVISAGTGSVTEDVNVSGGNIATGGTLAVIDVDAGQASFQAQPGTAGAYGTFVLGANGAWTYAAVNSNPAIQALGAGQTLTETFTVKSADGTSSSVVVTINGTNDAAVISSGTGSVTEDSNVIGGNISTGGTLTVADVDASQSTFQAQASTAGAYGSFTLGTSGAWTYTANNGNPAIQALGAGQTLTETFPVKSADGTNSSVVITINGTNDVAVISAGTGNVTEDLAVNGAGNLTTGGTLTVADVDVGQASFQPQASTAGAYGSFTLGTNGAWTYGAANGNPAIQALSAGQTLTETFTVKSVDGTNSSVVVTINGTNDVAVISAGAGSVTEDISVNGAGNLTTGGTLTVTDVDAGQASFQAQAGTAGAYGSFTLAANGAWTYAAANGNPAVQALGAGQTLTETFSVKSADGTASSVVVTLNGTNDAAVISAGTGSVTEDVSVNGAGNLTTAGTLAVTDADAGQSSFQAQAGTVGAYGTFTLGTSGAWTYTAANGNPAIQALGSGQTLTETFTVRSADGTSSSVIVTLNGTNDAAVISAGTGSVTEDVNVSGGNISTSGTLTVTDVDAGQSGFQAQPSTAGAYGMFTLGANGAWTYAAANGNPAIQALGAGQTLTETFAVKSADGTSSSVVVTINGTNDVAVISAGTGSVTEDVSVNGAGNLTTGGTLAVADVDAGQSSFQAQASTAGAYGTFTLAANGAWIYTAANNNPNIQALGVGQTLTETFSVKSADGTPSSVVVTINGTNDVAVISAGTGSVTEDLAVNGAGNLTTSGVLTVTDADTGQAGFQAQASTAGAYGSFTLGATGAWTYTAANSSPVIQALGAGQMLTETFTVRSVDGTSSSVVVTINGTNDVAVISAGTGNVTEDLAVNGAGNLATGGTLTVSDIDTGQAGFQAQTGTAGAYGTFTLGADGAWTYIAANGNPAIQGLGIGQTLTETFTVKSADGTSSSVVVTINGTNDAAVISAGSGGITEDVNVVGGNISTGGTLAVTDVDAGQASFQAQPSTVGAYGTFALAANGAWTYIAANSSPSIQALGAGQTLTETFTVKSMDGTSSTVVVTLNGTNDAAVISAGTGSVTEDVSVNGAGNLTTGGALAVTDADAGQATFQTQTGTAGTYGTFTLAANGAWTYTASNANPTIQALGTGQTLTETFTVKSTDGTSSSVVVIINGTNDVAVISTGTGSVTEDVNVAGGNINTGGTLTVSDVDAGQAAFQAQASTAGAYGNFTLGTNGAWTYVAANGNPAIQALGAGQTLTETFTVRSADGTSSSVVVTINGTNDVAVISAGTGSVTEDVSVNGAGNLTTGGTLTVTDVDTGQASFQAQASTAGAYGTFTLGTNGAWTYTAANGNPAIQALGIGQTLTETFTVKSADGTNSSVVVTLNGTNDVAVISAGTGSVTEDLAVDGAGNLTTSGTLTVTDVDAGQAGFLAQASTAGAYGTFTLGTNGAWTYTAANGNPTIQALGTGQTLTETFTVKSADGTSSFIVVTINGTNDVAVISAGTGSVTEDVAVNGAGNLTTGGTLTVTDTDTGQATFQTQTATAGAYGTFTLAANGAWTYAAANGNPAIQALGAGQTLTETFSVKSADGTISSVAVTLNGTNDVAVISGSSAGTVAEAGGVNNGSAGTPGATGTLGITDADAGQAAFQTPASLAGAYGSFTFNAGTGAWTYALDNARAATQALNAGQTVHDTLTVTSADGGTTKIIDVTVNGSNDNATIAGTATGSVTEAGGLNNGTVGAPTASGTLVAADVDAGQAIFQTPTAASLNGTYGTFTFNAGTGAWNYTLDNTRGATQALAAGQTVHDALSVASADGTAAQLIDVTITGSNDNAAIAGTATGSVTEAGGANNAVAGTPNAAGTLGVTDVDSGQAGFQTPTAASLNGSYGTFTFNAATGAWTYALNNNSAATQGLVAGQVAHDTLTVKSSDGTATQIIDVTVNGTNDNAAIAGTATGSVTEAGGVNNATAGTPNASGTLTVADVDNGQAVFQAPAAASLNGTYGSFTFNTATGAWTYALDDTRAATQALNAGQTAHDTLTVTSSDGSAMQVIDVTVNGSNDAATIAGTATGTVTEAGGVNNAVAGTPNASGTLSVADVDSAQAVFQTPASLAGTYGTFTFNAATGAWTYALNNALATTQGLAAGQTAHDTLTVASADGSATRIIDVTINGTNDNATIAGTTTGSVTEAGGANNGSAGTPGASGTLSVTDVDNGQAVFQTPAILAGTYGTFTFNTSTGAWTYALNNNLAATQALTASQTVHDTLTVTSSDGTASQLIDVTITGANDNATIVGTATGNVIEAGGASNGSAGTPTASGTLTVSDVDSGQAVFQTPASLAGTYGSFTFNVGTGAWSYTLDNTRAATQALTAGQTVHDTLSVKSSDGTATQIIDVTINGSNDNATVTGTATGSVTEAGGVNNGSAGTPGASGTLTIADVDAGQAVFQTPASLAGTYGSFTFNSSNGAWTYALNNSLAATQALTAGQTVHDTLTVASSDGTATQVIDVTVTGSNDTAAITGTATGAVTEAGGINNATPGTPTATGTLAVADVDAGQAGFQTPTAASLNGTYGSFTFNTATGTWNYTLDNTRAATQALMAGQTVHDTLTVGSTDGSASQVIDITVNGTNDSATISGTATGAVTEAGGLNNGTAGTPNASGTLTIGDVDSGQAVFQTPSSLAGTYGTFTFNAGTGAWTYALNNSLAATQALTAGQTVHDTLTVKSSDGTATQIIDVTVNGSNDNAVIGGTATGSVTEAGGVNNATTGTPNASGTLTISDIDSGQAVFQTPASLAGTYGTFTFNSSTGAWTYSLNNALAATQALNAGQSAHDTLTVTSADGSASQVIDVTVNGSNDNATIAGTATAVVTEAGGVNNGIAGTPNASGTLTVSDVDAGQAMFQTPSTLAGTYGTFSFNTITGAWTYALNNALAATQALTAGQAVHDTLSVASLDGTASQVIDVTVNGTNDNATIAGTATGAVTEAGGVNNASAGTPNASGTLTVTDVDAGQAAFQTPAAASLNGTYGTFSFNAGTGAWTYALNNALAATQALAAGQTAHDTLTVTSTDGTAMQVIDVTVNGANDNATIGGAATGTVTEAGGVNNATAGAPNASGTLTITDVDAGQAVFQTPAAASLNGSYGNFTFNASTGAWTYVLNNALVATQALTAGQVAHDTLTVASSDGTATRIIDVTVNGTNDNAAIGGTATGSVTEAGGLNNAAAGTPNASGTLSIGDVDAGQAVFQTPAGLVGTYGSFAFNTATGAWTYALDNTRAATQALTAGQAVHDTLSVTSSDGTATQVIDVSVTGANDTAVIGGTATGAVTEAGGVNNGTAGTPNASGTLTITDVDAGQAVFQTPASLAGTYGSFTFNAATGAWTYALNNSLPATQALTAGQTVHDTLTVASSDGSASRIIDITVTGSNDAAVIGGAATGSVTEDVAVNGAGNLATGGTLTVSDVDSGQASYQAGTTAGTYGSFVLAANGAWTYTAANNNATIQALGIGQTLQETFVVRSADGTSSNVVVTINGTNDAPLGREATVTTAEDTPFVFGASNFLMNDVEQGNNANSNGVRIDSLPSNGSLYLSGVLVGTGQVITAADIAAGKLSFVPNLNDNGTAYATLTFSVRDAAGDFDTVPNTVTVNVTPVSDGAPLAGADVYNTTLGTPVIITQAQLLANDALPDHAHITLVTGLTSGTGTLVDNGNGTYTYTPAANGAAKFNYTLTDDDGQTSTASVTINTTSAKDDLGTVYESALADGTGGGSTTATGNLFSNDGGGASVTNVKYNGTTYTASGGVITINTAIGTLVVQASGTGAGNYTYTLKDNADNSAAADDLSKTEVFTYTSNTATSADLRISVIDDKPVAYDHTVQVSQNPLPSYNLVLVLDVSGSMTAAASGGEVRQVNDDGTTTISNRLTLAKAALVSLATEYFNQAQNVSIKLITFSDSATILNGGAAYTSKAAAIAAINGITGSGGTNYESALTAVKTAFGTVDTAKNNAVYFLSDGEPSVGNLNPVSATGYDTFVASNGIESYAVGIGTGIANPAQLNNIHNVDADGNGVKDGAIIVPDLNQLDSALVSTVPPAFGGNVVSNGAVSNVLGADGGYVKTVVLKLDSNNDGVADQDVTFSYNKATNQITQNSSFLTGYPKTSDLLTVGTSAGFKLGTLTFNFSTGNYTYYTNGTAQQGDSFSLKFVATDGDGDVTPQTTLTFQIANGLPVARPDTDTLMPNQTHMDGNVITGLGTDGGLALNSQVASFAAKGGGVDNAVDNAQVSSVSFQGQTYSLAANSSGSGAGFTYTVSNGQLTWTGTDGSKLVFSKTGYYDYMPPTASLPVAPHTAPVTTQFISAAAASLNGVALTGYSRTGVAQTLTYTNSTGTASDGVGVNGGGSGSNVDNLEQLVVSFSQASHPYGVQDVSFVVATTASNLGSSNGTVSSLTYTVYDVAGNELGQFYSSSEGTVTVPSTFTNIGSIEIEANSAASARITSVTFDDVQLNSAAAAAAPVTVGYTLNDDQGDTSSSTLTLNVISNNIFGDANANTITGTAANDHIVGGAGNDVLDGGAGHDIVEGGLGNDTLSGSDGNDVMRGGAGNDALNGGNGNDVLTGGAGNDVLTGGTGSDVFRWEFADKGSAGAPAGDVVTDFDNAVPAAGGDVLDLRDLLQGETLAGAATGNLTSFLHFAKVGSDTVIQISSNGGFSGGFNAGAVDQSITLQNVDLFSSGMFSTDQQVIQDLLSKSKLLVDGA